MGPNVNITNGGCGVFTIADLQTYNAPAGTYIRYIQIITDATIVNYIDDAEVNGGYPLVSINLISGLLIEGRFSSISLGTGVVRCYLEAK